MKEVEKAGLVLLLLCSNLLGQDGLIAYFPFNGNTNDESGSANHAIANGPTLTADRFGKPDSACSFDGIDDFLRIPYHPSLYPASLSATVWVKVSESLLSGKYILTSSGDVATPPFDPFRLRLKISRKITSRFEGDEDRSQIDLESESKLELGRWYFIATSYDANTGNASLYINGNLEDVTSLKMVLDRNELGYMVGAGQRFDGQPDSTTHFSGSIDDIRLYDRAISEAEVQSLFNKGTQFEIKIEMLEQNFPNPFNPTTRIRYVLAVPAKVVLNIFAITGQKVRTLVNANQAAGLQVVDWNGTDHNGRRVASGLYIYRIEAGRQDISKKMLLLN